MIKAVLFDLDGTLLNTLDDIRYFVNEMLSRHGYPTISREQTAAYVGDGAKKLIERALPENADVESCFSEFMVRFSASDGKRTTLYDGELQTLVRLRERGMRLAVITNKPQAAADGCIRQFFPEKMFDFVGGDSGRFPRKPDPALSLYCAKVLHVPPSQCAFVGDGETDAEVAKAAGMHGIGALWGYRSKKQLLSVGANLFASDFSRLSNILEIL